MGVLGKTTAAVGSLSATLLLTGCGASVHQVATSTPAVTPPPVASDPTESSLPKFPVDTYLPNQADSNVVYGARYALVAKCVAQYGVSWTAPQLPAAGFDARRLWGVMTVSDAEQFGYHFPTSLGLSKAPGVATAPLSNQTELVLHGTGGASTIGVQTPSASSEVAGKAVPVGGCFGEADRQIFGGPDDLSTYELAAINIGLKSHNEATTDPQVVDLENRWSDCMSASGYHYATPYDALSDPAWGPPQTGGPSDREKAVAIADMTCKDATNFIASADGIEISYEQKAIAAARSTLLSQHTRWEQIVARAQQLPASATPATSPE